MTQRRASTRFDLPQPFGPTTPVRPGSISSSVGSTNDLKPDRRSLVICTGSAADERCHGERLYQLRHALESPISLLGASGPQHAVVRPGRSLAAAAQELSSSGSITSAQRLDAARARIDLAVHHQGRRRAHLMLVLAVEPGLQDAVDQLLVGQALVDLLVAHAAELAELLERAEIVARPPPSCPGSRTARRESRNSGRARRSAPAPRPSAPARRAESRGRSAAPCRSRCSAPSASGSTSVWNWAQCGQVSEAYSIRVTGASGSPRICSPGSAAEVSTSARGSQITIQKAKTPSKLPARRTMTPFTSGLPAFLRPGRETRPRARARQGRRLAMAP